MTSVLLDVSTLVANPVRSGIQRVEREAMRHWPADVALAPAVQTPDGGWRRLPEAARALLCDGGADRRAAAEEVAELAAMVRAAPALAPERQDIVLNLELFYEAWRAEAYRALCRERRRVRWLVYDFIPWLQPSLFPPGTTRACMHYLRAVRDVPRLAFISEATRRDFALRIAQREVDGPVLPLGADGLGLEAQGFSPSRRDVVVLGTIEPRKNPMAAMDGFRRHWASGGGLRLVLAGRIDAASRPALATLAAEAGSRLTVLDQPDDATLRHVLQGARAVLSASTAEGFGLAPWEALHAGIPAIATPMPSLAALPPADRAGTGGAWLKLGAPTAEAVSDALALLADDGVAAALWAGAAALVLPGWGDFARRLADWACAD